MRRRRTRLAPTFGGVFVRGTLSWLALLALLPAFPATAAMTLSSADLQAGAAISPAGSRLITRFRRLVGNLANGDEVLVDQQEAGNDDLSILQHFKLDLDPDSAADVRNRQKVMCLADHPNAV